MEERALPLCHVCPSARMKQTKPYINLTAQYRKNDSHSLSLTVIIRVSLTVYCNSKTFSIFYYISLQDLIFTVTVKVAETNRKCTRSVTVSSVCSGFDES
jgi:hypothetical protein